MRQLRQEEQLAQKRLLELSNHKMSKLVLGFPIGLLFFAVVGLLGQAFDLLASETAVHQAVLAQMVAQAGAPEPINISLTADVKEGKRPFHHTYLLPAQPEAAPAAADPAAAFIAELHLNQGHSANQPTYALVPGEGDHDNERFFMNGNRLYAHQPLATASQQAFQIRVAVSGADGRLASVPIVIHVMPGAPANLPLGKTAVPLADGTLSPIFTKEVLYWEAEISAWAAEYNLDPNIIATIMQIESCGNPEAVSVAGAAGLFQVMPFHFAPGENMFHPPTNARRGLGYFNEGLHYHAGDILLTFAGYNAGHGTVITDPARWPNETQQYFYWSKGIYEEARAGLTTSPTLQEWQRMRGNSLCWQAANRLGL